MTDYIKRPYCSLITNLIISTITFFHLGIHTTISTNVKKTQLNPTLILSSLVLLERRQKDRTTTPLLPSLTLSPT